MAINVVMAESKSAWGRHEFIDVEIFIEDGHYHFLLPEIMELKSALGKFIDQYGDAFFEPHTLIPLLTYLRKAQGRAFKMNRVENVVIGIEQKSNQEVRIAVQKKDVTSLIGKLIAATEKAELEAKYLIFIGD